LISGYEAGWIRRSGTWGWSAGSGLALGKESLMIEHRKSLSTIVLRLSLNKRRRRPTRPPVTAIPSARAGLTALFGMGRGEHRRYRHPKIFNVSLRLH